MNNNNNEHSLRSNTKVMAAKLPRLTHKIAVQLQLVAQSCTICGSRCKTVSPETFGYTLVCSYNNLLNYWTSFTMPVVRLSMLFSPIRVTSS
jgi:hypothetical protein